MTLLKKKPQCALYYSVINETATSLFGEIPFAVKKSSSSSGRFSNATLVRLSDFLSAGYKKGVRPVKDWRTSTTVAIDLMVYSILNVVGSTATLGELARISASNNFVLFLQDEKNQVLTTYVWYRQVRPACPLCWAFEFLLTSFVGNNHFHHCLGFV